MVSWFDEDGIFWVGKPAIAISPTRGARAMAGQFLIGSSHHDLVILAETSLQIISVKPIRYPLRKSARASRRVRPAANELEYSLAAALAAAKPREAGLPFHRWTE